MMVLRTGIFRKNRFNIPSYLAWYDNSIFRFYSELFKFHIIGKAARGIWMRVRVCDIRLYVIYRSSAHHIRTAYNKDRAVLLIKDNGLKAYA